MSKVVTVKLSTCCDAKSLGEIAHNYANNGDGGWGICSQCHDWTMFEADEYNGADMDDWDEIDFPNTSPTTTPRPFTIPPTATDAQRLKTIGPQCDLPTPIVDNFQPKIISWVTPRIGITSRDGVPQALEDGHFVINTAEEIINQAHIKIAVKVGSGQVLRQLNQLKDIMTNVLNTTDQKVVVHCAMGMERSALTVIWFMANTLGMTLETALAKCQEKRPIVLNRLSWIAK